MKRMKEGEVESGPFLLALYSTCATIVGGPFSGAAMNPFRSFAPMFVSGQWSMSFLAHLFGSLGGAVTASFLCRLFHKERD